MKSVLVEVIFYFEVPDDTDVDDLSVDICNPESTVQLWKDVVGKDYTPIEGAKYNMHATENAWTSVLSEETIL